MAGTNGSIVQFQTPRFCKSRQDRRLLLGGQHVAVASRQGHLELMQHVQLCWCAGCWTRGPWLLVVGSVSQSLWCVRPAYCSPLSETSGLFTSCCPGTPNSHKGTFLYIITGHADSIQEFPHSVSLVNFNNWLILTSYLSLLAHLLSWFWKMIRLFFFFK